MNGYFQLITSGRETLLHLFPETNGGEPLTFNEVTDYLRYKSINYNSKLLKEGFDKHEDTIVPLNTESRYPEREMCIIRVSNDCLHATIRFYAPSDNGGVMDRAEIMSDIAYHKIVYGVKEESVDSFVANREYCRDYELAEGTPVRPGRNAQIEYMFNTDVQARPTLNEDGSVDFFHLNTINCCDRGDVLAKLHPELEGENGTTVYGEKIAPPHYEKKALKFGKNVSINEEKNVLTADVNGHIIFSQDGRVSVSDVLEVKDVDTSTGNIDYAGSVHISGNIRQNFSVKAKGNVIVGGIVEGAYVEAGGDIVIGRGMNGMEKGILKSKGNIVAKFLENTSAAAAGYVEAESILHSRVVAGEEIVVTGRRAFISGGTATAGKKITAKTLGSQMGASTTLEVGVKPEVRARLTQLQKEAAELQNAIRQIDPVVQATLQKVRQGARLSPDQAKHVQGLAAASAEKKKILEDYMKEMDELNEQLDASTDACVVVTDVIYPGTKVLISDSSLVIKQAFRYCRFRRVRGDVKSEPI